MLNIGTHVFCRRLGVRANGIVIGHDCGKYPYDHKIKYFWAKHSKNVDRMSQIGWERQAHLAVLFHDNDLRNKPEMNLAGNRSLDNLIRKVCGFRSAMYRDQADVIINYGTYSQLDGICPWYTDSKVINRVIGSNKYRQQKALGHTGLGAQRWRPANVENWIIKPDFSIGGKNIRPAVGDGLRNEKEYFQKRFPKVREFRAHFFRWLDDPVPLIQEKVIDDRDQLCWNEKQGGRFWYVYQKGLESYVKHPISAGILNRIVKVSKRAMEKLGHDMGGIDIGMAANGTMKVFEVNSRMGIKERSLFTYKMAFYNIN